MKNATLRRVALGVIPGLLLGGCGWFGTKDKDASATRQSRKNTGKEAPIEARAAEKQKAEAKPAAASEVKAADPLKADADFMESNLEKERNRLTDRAKLEFDKLNEYTEKQHQLTGLIDEYRLRHQETQNRIRNIERVMAAIETDPGVFSREQAKKAAAAREDISACAAPAVPPAPVWRDSPADSAGAAYVPPVENTVTLPSVPAAPAASGEATAGKVAGPPLDEDAPRTAVKAPAAPVAAAPAATGNKPLETKVLASDGKGADSTAIIGVGERDGVERGMLFAVGDPADRAVLVVTEVYGACARAVPHPQFPPHEISGQAKAVQISQLPR